MESATTTTEDSGLIDLKAIAAKAESTRPPALNAINESLAPLEAAPAEFASPFNSYAPIGSEAAPKSRLQLLIGVGAATALLLVLGIVIGFKVGGAAAPAPVTTASASMMPIPLVTATAEPSAEPSVSAAAQPSASEAPVVAKTPKPHSYGGGARHKPQVGAEGGPGVTAAGARAGASGAAATTRVATGAGGTKTAVSPKKGDCGCNGDLTCMMKCSTQK
jgi:hypothetical protein